MNRGFLNLLQQADHELYEMYKAYDEELADEKLEIEIARQFIHKALNSEDRMDIFKALQKAYDIFQSWIEIEDDLEDTSKGYTSMAERLKQALEGLHENTGMKNSELKLLTKFVIKEIGFPDNKDRSQHPLAGLISALFSLPKDMLTKQRATQPFETDPEMAYKTTSEMIDELQDNMKGIVNSILKSDTESLSKYAYHYGNIRDVFNILTSKWLIKSLKAFPDTKYFLDGFREETIDIINNVGRLCTLLSEDAKDFREYVKSLSGKKPRLTNFKNRVAIVQKIRDIDKYYDDLRKWNGEFHKLISKIPPQKKDI
jgi:hypothetical protein